jgi:hypothetical protein
VVKYRFVRKVSLKFCSSLPTLTCAMDLSEADALHCHSGTERCLTLSTAPSLPDTVRPYVSCSTPCRTAQLADTWSSRFVAVTGSWHVGGFRLDARSVRHRPILQAYPELTLDVLGFIVTPLLLYKLRSTFTGMCYHGVLAAC